MKTIRELKVGDILVTTWGYEARVADFYKIIGRTAATFSVVRLGTTKTGDWIDGTSSPTEEEISDPIRVKIRTHVSHKDPNLVLEYLKVGSHYCWKWDGHPVSTFNHH